MNYMPIVPVGMLPLLDDIEGVTDVFILPQLFDIEEYKDFYMSRKWNNVIIDNALYENGVSLPFCEMIDFADMITADRVFIVGPEDFNSGVKTGNRIVDVVDEFGRFGSSWEIMAILHNEPVEMRYQYDYMESNGAGGIALGISVNSWRLGFDRASLAEYLGINRRAYLHAFGSDNLMEMVGLKNVGYNSVDCSMPVTAAVNDMRLFGDAWQIDRRVTPDVARVDLTQKSFTKKQIDMSRENIMKVMAFCK